MAVCTITSRSHGNGKTDIGLSNLDMPTKRAFFMLVTPTTIFMKNVYLLKRSIIMQAVKTEIRKYFCLK